MNLKKIYPRSNDRETVYLKNVITDPEITVGNYTIYNDFVNDPCQFEKNNVLYHYPVNLWLPIRSPSFLKNGIWTVKV